MKLVLKKVKSLPLFVPVLWRLEPREVTCKSSIVIAHGHTISCNNFDSNNDNSSYYNCVKIFTNYPSYCTLVSLANKNKNGRKKANNDDGGDNNRKSIKEHFWEQHTFGERFSQSNKFDEHSSSA